jgi:hypothetical protein
MTPTLSNTEDKMTRNQALIFGVLAGAALAVVRWLRPQAAGAGRSKPFEHGPGRRSSPFWRKPFEH